MRILLSLFLFICCFSSNAQLLDPSVDWFGLNDFFNEEVIRDRAITQLDIKVTSKSDGKIIMDSGEELHYAFNASGHLLSAKKRVPLYRGYDTASVDLRYDDSRRIIQKVEQYGPYHFEYRYQYTSDSTFNSLKLRPTKEGYDTLYYRLHQLKYFNDLEIERISNQNGIVFLTEKRKYNVIGNPLEAELEYVFSHHQRKIRYDYVGENLIQMHLKTDYGQRMNSKKNFEYENGILKEVKHYEKDQLTKRITFTYAMGLPTAAIMRIVEDKEIKIFLFDYSFY